MSLNIYPENALIKRIKKHKGAITFIIGSAFSQKDKNGFGIPNVDGVIQFIDDYIERDDPEDLENFRAELKNCTHQERYQKAFAYLSGHHGPDVINEIIADVIKSNEDENGKQRIPKAVCDFVMAVKNKSFHVKNIVTTNFDTLLEDEFRNQGIDCNSYSLVNDTHFQVNVNDLVNVFHLHGKWNQDSMHTLNQLQVKRSSIEISLQNLVKDDLVVVIAYGGWEDSFARALANVVTNPMLDYQILWTFFEYEDAIILSKRDDLLNSLKDAITRGRVNFYKGIDCNSVFEKLYEGKDEVNELKKK